MKKVIAISLMSLFLGSSAAWANWSSYIIRNSADNTAPTINDIDATTKEFVIDKASMKAGWGTGLADGYKLGSLGTIRIDRLDDTTRFTAGSGPAVAPYLNIWITDGAGNFAVVANEPSNAEWAGGVKWNMTWDDLKTKTVKVYENDDKSWLPNSGVGLTFSDLANFEILAPSVAQLTAGWTGLGGGAPRELGTNLAYGINWIFGDTLANYVSGDEGYIVANPLVTIVPAPGAALLAFFGLGLVGWVKRRMA